MFDNYAASFDDHLTKKLEYNIPSDLTEFIYSNASLSDPVKKVLDLGCGTGLLGQALVSKFNIEHLIGIDLSTNMLEKSKSKAVYNELHNTDLLEYLQDNNDMYDIITAADVFIYVGNLDAVMRQVHQRLKPGGYFAFSVESTPNGSYKLMPWGRFQHSLDYIQTLSADIGFTNTSWNDVALRKEHGVMVQGYLVLMQK